MPELDFKARALEVRERIDSVRPHVLDDLLNRSGGGSASGHGPLQRVLGSDRPGQTARNLVTERVATLRNRVTEFRGGGGMLTKRISSADAGHQVFGPTVDPASGDHIEGKSASTPGPGEHRKFG